LKCTDCYNSARLGRDAINYKFNVNTTTCDACDTACFTCGVNQSCEVCVDGFGLFNKSGSTTVPV